MNRAPFGWLSRPWLVVSASLLALAIPGLLLWSPWEGKEQSGTLRLYCAAGLTRPVSEIIDHYQKECGGRIEPTFDGAGKLLSTIRVVGGGDLYLCSDSLALEEARKQHLIAETIPIAVLRPVLIVNQRTQSRLREQGKPVTGVEDLLRDDLKVVLANPQLATIGKITQRALPGEIWEALQEESSPRVSTVGTVTEVAQAVRIKDDYVGVVWSATARQFEELEIITPPEFQQVHDWASIAILKKTTQPTAALKFARYLAASNRGLEVFKHFNFEPVVEADFWPEEPHKKGRPTIHLAAGAMLMPAVEDALKAFGEREGVTINTDFQGCGQLVAKMKVVKHAPDQKGFPDAYFSCDQTFLDMVQPWFQPGVTVARNDLVLIVPKGNPAGIKTLADLKKDVRVGLAHPVNSALGKLTDDLLLKLGFHGEVYRQDRRQAIVHTDAAHTLVNQMAVKALDAAVVYRSNVLGAGESTRAKLDVIEVELPEAQAVQPFAIAKETPYPRLLMRLQQALTGDEQQARFRQLGFHWLYKD